MLNQDESAMKRFVSWSWNTVKHVESGWIRIMKHLKSGWKSVFHDYDYDNETDWIRSNDQIDIVTAMLITNLIKLFSYIGFWFMMFHGILKCFTALFHGVWKYFKVSLPCFIPFHNHETGAVETSLYVLCSLLLSHRFEYPTDVTTHVT